MQIESLPSLDSCPTDELASDSIWDKFDGGGVQKADGGGGDKHDEVTTRPSSAELLPGFGKRDIFAGTDLSLTEVPFLSNDRDSDDSAGALSTDLLCARFFFVCFELSTSGCSRLM